MMTSIDATHPQWLSAVHRIIAIS
ncbi:hypothetical protein V3C99_013847 [Haemonchus contortus]